MIKKNNKKLLFGALSAVVASVAAGVLVKNKMDKKSNENNSNVTKEKKSKNVYYTVHLNDIYSSYDDKTLSEEDMIEEIRKETSL